MTPKLPMEGWSAAELANNYVKAVAEIASLKEKLEKAREALDSSKGLVAIIASLDQYNDYRDDVRKQIKLTDDALALLTPEAHGGE